MKKPLALLVVAACGGSKALPFAAAEKADAASPDQTPPSDAGGPSAPSDASAPVECVLGQSSTLAGVAIRFTTPGCTFTLAQAKAGISIPYELDIDADIPNVIPGGATSAPSLGPSGLDLSAVLSGNNQHYCICDVGLGVGLPQTPETLKTGTYPTTFDWDGHNWNGPSDTGNAEGALFPAGDYELDVSTGGKKDGTDFTVEGRLLVHLVP